MDIQRWLQATADRQPPEDPLAPPKPDFALEEGNAGKPERRYRRKRRGYHSDSSIIAPLIRTTPDRNDDTVHGRRRRSDRERHQRESVSPAQSLDRRHPLENESQSGPDSPEPVAKTYERRPRHKTKADKYEPKKKKSKKDRTADAEDGLKSRRRRSHRSGDGSRTAGLIQSFQLKNGGKSGRLTLKADGNAGLFSHGRASAQLVGKNSGLPDLVFNEMRFLQKSKEPAESAFHPASRKLTKQDARRQIENGEISAYFDALTALPRKQSPAQEDDDRPPADEHMVPPLEPFRHGEAQRHRTETLRALKDTSHPTAPAEVSTNRPAPRTRSTSYFAWSQSEPRPTPKQTLHKVVASQTRSQLPDSGPPEKRQEEAGRHTIQPLHDPPGPGIWMQTNRAPAESLVEVYKPCDLPRTSLRRTASQTSLSLPGLPKRSPKAAVNSTAAHSTSAGPTTPDILRIRNRMHALARDDNAMATLQSDLVADKENVEPSSLSPTTKLLRTAQVALNDSMRSRPGAHTIRLAQDKSRDRSITRDHVAQHYATESDALPNAHQYPRARPTSSWSRRGPVPNTLVACRPPTGVAFGFGLGMPDHRIWGDPRSQHAPSVAGDDEEMLDVQPDRYFEPYLDPSDLETLHGSLVPDVVTSIHGGSGTRQSHVSRARSTSNYDPPPVRDRIYSVSGKASWSPSGNDEYSTGFELRPPLSRDTSTRRHSSHGAAMGSGMLFSPAPPVPPRDAFVNAGAHRIWGPSTLH